jgi:hypothetical protein
MAEYGFDFRETGADDAATLLAGNPNNVLVMPSDYWFLDAIDAGVPQTPNATSDDMVDVPHWYLVAACERAYHSRLATDAFAVDAFMHATTMAYTLDNAATHNFHRNAQGELRTWPTVEAFAVALGAFADDRRSGADESPWVVYDGDHIEVAQPALVAPHTHFNHLLVQDSAKEGNLYPHLRLTRLLFPMGNGVDLSDDENRQAVVLRLLDSTARAAFPALATTSTRLAIVALLSVDLPVMLQHASVSLDGIVYYIGALAKWANAATRLELVADNFHRLLPHTQTLASWVRGTARPFFRARELLTAIKGATAAPDCDGFGALDEALGDCADYWSDGRTADENCDYLLQRLRSRSGQRSGSASGSGHQQEGSGEVVDVYARQLNDLSVRLESHFDQANAGTFGAIELVYESGATSAVRWLHGKGVKAEALPPIFAASCSGFPSRLEAYWVDTVLHDDDGRLDPDLEDVVEATFYQLEKGKTVPLLKTFYDHLRAGTVLKIDWDGDFVLKILRTLDPTARYMTPVEVILDPDRRAAHKLYIGRLLHGMGKPQDAPASLAAAWAYWEPALARCKQGGPELAADCVDEIVTLMTAVWASGEMLMTDALRLGTPWTESLYDAANMRAFERFDKFVEDSAQIRRLAKRFKRSGLPSSSTSAQDEQAATSTALVVAPEKGKQLQKGERPPPKAPGANVGNIQRDGEWVCHNSGNGFQYHITKCQQLFTGLGFPDQCVLVVSSTSGSLAHATAWCERGHSVECPQHALYHKYEELKVADKLVEGEHYRVNPERKPRKTPERAGGRAAARGNQRGGGGGRPFQRRPAQRS